MELITGTAQHYAWGDAAAIPELLGVEPGGRPWAEWWLGTHAGGPATLADGSPLASIGGELPYLLKLLAAAEPLSLQVHPTSHQASVGFKRENAAGLAIDAPTRIYRDASAKPELLCALTMFDTLCGFRPVEVTLALLDEIGAAPLAAELRETGLAALVRQLYHHHIELDTTIAACACSTRPEAQLVTKLAAEYPGDPSVLVTLLLNRVLLQPGEAIFLGAGNLHAYLNGLGVEIMASSDNVVRGGLTVKHVDVDELLQVVDITPLEHPVVEALVDGGSASYPTPGTPFHLVRLDVDGHYTHTATGRELVLCTAGDVGSLRQGQCAYLARDERISFDGQGQVFRVEER